MPFFVCKTRYEDFLQAAKCRRQPRAFDCQRRRRWIRLVHIQRKPKPISPIQAPDTDVFAADINANVPDGHQGDFEAESGAAICPSTDEDDAPQHLLCPISGKLLEDPVVLSSGHTYERKALDEFVATHRVTTDGDDAIDGEDGDASIPLLFLTEPLPTHACIVDAAEVSGTAEGGGKGVTAFMKQQVYSNLLALAAVDDFTAQVSCIACRVVCSGCSYNGFCLNCKCLLCSVAESKSQHREPAAKQHKVIACCSRS